MVETAKMNGGRKFGEKPTGRKHKLLTSDGIFQDKLVFKLLDLSEYQSNKNIHTRKSTNGNLEERRQYIDRFLKS